MTDISVYISINYIYINYIYIDISIYIIMTDLLCCTA